MQAKIVCEVCTCMSDIEVDPILESVCLPLQPDEFELLEQQILRDGCQDALKVWDKDGKQILLDGHNRLKICRKHKLPYDTSTIEIDSIDEAIIWIVDNQKGRRNVATSEQRDYISGKRRAALKNINRARDESGVFKSCAPSTENMVVDNSRRGQVILQQARDEGVSHFKIEQNEKFAKGVDAVREVSPYLAEKILKPDPAAPKLTKGAVAALPKLKEANPNKFIETVEELAGALETKDKKVIEATVRDHGLHSNAQKEAAALAKFQAFNKVVDQKTAEAHARIDRIMGNFDTCLMPNVSEMWCNDCKWGFDIFLPAPGVISCPYCKGSNLVKRDPEWNPREAALDKE